MLTDLSDALARLALSRLAPDRAHPRADLDRLPPLLAHALRRRLDREVDARLGEAAPWVSPVPDLWREDADVAPRFPAAVWAPVLRETSAWVVEALVHPADALPARLPESGETDTEEVLDRMDELGAYPYLSELVARYAEKKALAGYDRETLHRLIDRVDRRIANELDTDGWRALLGPLYDLVGALPDYPDGVPGRVLAEVFAARGRPGLGADMVDREALGLDELAAYLDEALAAAPDDEPTAEEIPTDSQEVLPVELGTSVLLSSDAPAGEAEVDDFADVLPEAETDAPPEATPEAALTVAELLARAHAPADAQEPDVLPAADEDPVGDPPAPAAPLRAETAENAAGPQGVTPLHEPIDPDPSPAPERGKWDPVPEAEPAPADEEEPLWARLARSQGLTPDALTQAPDEDAEPLWRRFTSGDADAEPPSAPPPASGASSDPAAELEARVLGDGVDQRALYVESLFRGDETDYHRVLALLDRAPTWTEATAIIGREVFRRYHVHIYSEPAASFTDAVERQFSNT